MDLIFDFANNSILVVIRAPRVQIALTAFFIYGHSTAGLLFAKGLGSEPLFRFMLSTLAHQIGGILL
jgi:hypothetical protein